MNIREMWRAVAIGIRDLLGNQEGDARQPIASAMGFAMCTSEVATPDAERREHPFSGSSALNTT